MQYSVGFTLTEITAAAVDLIPAHVWTPAYDAEGKVRDGAWVAELTGLIDLTGWPPGMRVIVREERPHPGAQLRFTDRDGLRLTAFATNATRGQLTIFCATETCLLPVDFARALGSFLRRVDVGKCPAVGLLALCD